ncbi:MAG: CHAT domain-containing protein [Bacteroidetes bacterium]|nr:CHAT domain-containing protein [Bacteroidota bacterium]MBU1717716.1 CHAT domain-containing protein [Bacteroidota bacterium]
MMFRFLFLLAFMAGCCVLSAKAQYCNDKEKATVKALASGKVDDALAKANAFFLFAEKEYKDTDTCYRKALLHMADALDRKELYDSAIVFWSEGMKMVLKRMTDFAPMMAVSMSSTTQMFESIPNKKQASEMYRKALPILLSVDTTDYSMIIKITNLYTESFSKYYGQGEDTTTNKLKSIGEKYGKTSNEYLAELKVVANEFREKWKQTEARNAYGELLNVLKERGEIKSVEYADALYHLGFLQFMQMNYDSSRFYIDQAISTYEDIRETNNESYTWALFYCGILYQFEQKWNKTIEIYEKGMKSFRKFLGAESPYFTTILVTLGNLYLIDNDYKNAEKYLLEDLKNKENDTVEANRMASYIGLGRVEMLKKNMAKAEDYFVKANRITAKQIYDLQDIVGISTEKKVAQYFSAFRYSLNTFYTVFGKRANENPAIAGQIFDDELLSKGLILRIIRDRIELINNSGDSELIANFNQWIDIRQQLAKLALLPMSERKANINVLENDARNIENNMYYKIYQSAKSTKPPALTWQAVQKNLKPDEAVVEFIHYDHYMYGEAWINDSALYGALVLRPGDTHPYYFPLFDEKTFRSFLGSFSNLSSYDLVNQMYEVNGDSLFAMVWKPIEERLSGAKTVYYSPSGLLHKVSFNAVPCSEGKVLSDKYDLFLLSSSAMLTNNKKPFLLTKEDDVRLYGGIFYDLDSNSIDFYSKKFKEDMDDFFIHDRSMEWSDSIRGGSFWPYLEGTLNEVEYISKLLDKNSVKQSKVIGKEAVEESFKYGETGSPKVIHIATHGFFFPDPDSKSPKDGAYNVTEAAEAWDPTRDPMIRSGLIFAGANHVWQGEKAILGAEDGILTAFEVSKMNLSKTRLVVMSACETGLGDIRGSEGVYGLQRAFMIAGVEYVIMSLWQIPDEQTVELMNIFYSEWMKGKDIRQAFLFAQRELRKKYPPYFWAAFVLME